VPQKELDLLQLASRSVAKPSTGTSQIVGRQLRHAYALGGFLHNVPNRLHRHTISPSPSNSVDPAEQLSSINCGCGNPIVQFGSHPIGNWNRSNVASLANQIDNGPMLFALLEMIQSQSHGFMPPQAAREQQREQCSVAFSLQSLMIGCLPKCLALLCGQPIAEAHSQLLHALSAANTSRQIGAEETAVGGLVCKPAHGTET
jgi:hypothetical protein